MVTKNRFRSGPLGWDDTAQKLFENGETLNLSLTRGKGKYGPFLVYELHGSFDANAHDLRDLAAQLLTAFSELPRMEVGGDADDA